MKIISINNLKGGVGKTTTTGNIGYEFAKQGEKVLLIDNDKQGNLSKMFGVYNPDEECGVAKILLKEWKTAEDIIKQTSYKNIDIIDSNISLVEAVLKLVLDVYGTSHMRFKALLSVFEEKGYDYVIIDNPPDIDLGVINALMITDKVLIPTKIDEWGLEGLDIILGQIKQVRELNSNIEVLGAIATLYKNNDVNNRGISKINERSDLQVIEKVRYSEKVNECTFVGGSAYEYSSRSAASQDYKRIANKLLNGEI